MSPSSTCERTDWTLIRSRTIVKSLTSFFGPRTILSLTGELIAPRILSTAWSSVRPCVGVVVDRGDDVARQDAGLGGRRVVDRRDDLDEAVLLGDLDAEAAELALGLDLHVLERLGVHVARMRVERGEHAVDGRLDQLGFVGLLDIVVADLVEHVAEQIELAIGVGRGGVGGGADVRKRLRARRRSPRRPERRPSAKYETFRFIRAPFRCLTSPTTAPDRSPFRLSAVRYRERAARRQLRRPPPSVPIRRPSRRRVLRPGRTGRASR